MSSSISTAASARGSKAATSAFDDSKRSPSKGAGATGRSTPSNNRPGPATTSHTNSSHTTAGGGSQFNTGKSVLNQRAALVSAYNELGKELSSTKLKAVGNYTLGRTIGEGTFGKVRIGTHRLTGTRVAIKQVPKSHSASLTREIHHHRRLHHANVMKLYEVLATESNIWMISELCLGGELYDYLVERGVLPEAEARRIFGQLCLALAYIHGRGIVHRDLKLENVLLDERCNVKLGDFGFTREFEGKRLMETFCGTTGYAAPEMLAGKKYTGEEVDIWSLGIILYALLCGSLPFDDDDESVMKSKILKGDFELPAHLSEEARDLVSDILKLDPTKRLSIRAILAHPWFTKLMVTTPMSTVAEDPFAGSYFPDQPEEHSVDDEPKGGDNLSNARPAVAQAASDASLLGLGVDLGVMSDTSSQPSEAAHGISDSESSDHRSLHSGTTDPTSVEDLPSKSIDGISSGSDSHKSFHDAISSHSSDGNQRSAEVAQDQPDHDRRSEWDRASPSSSSEPTDSRRNTVTIGDSKRIGMQHRNESQTTIRRNGSSGSEGAPGAAATTGGASSFGTRASLPTHHESIVTGSGGTGNDVAAAESWRAAAGDAASSSSPEGGFDDDSPQKAFAEIVKTSTGTTKGPSGSVNLVKRDSQSSSRGHHRTPSRTKRRSLSSGGLSDHHPPHLATRPVDYLGMLEQSQPAIFSTTMEQNLLHQIGNLGMDVGQIVHSILTDACDASAAMWWLLKRKQEEREETDKMFPSSTSASSHPHTLPNAHPRSAQGALNFTTAPPLPPKDPMRSVSTSSSRTFSPLNQNIPLSRDERRKDGANTTPSKSPLSMVTDGLPMAAQQSFRRHLDRAAQDQQHPSLAQAFAVADANQPHRSREELQRSMTDFESTASRAVKSQENVTLEHDLLASPRPGKTRRGSLQAASNTDEGSSSPRSQSGKAEDSRAAEKADKRSRPNRNRTSSLSLKLASVLSGNRKDTAGSTAASSAFATPPSGATSQSEDTVRGPEERERAKSPVVGFFSSSAKRGPATYSMQKVDALPKKAPLEPPPTLAAAATSPETTLAPHLHAQPSAERDTLGSSSPPPALVSSGSPKSTLVDSSPSKKSTRTSSSRDALSTTSHSSKNVGGTPIPASNSVDTFTTISTLQSSGGADSSDAGVGMARYPAATNGKPKSSFLSTMRTWLGTDEKQPRRKGKKKDRLAAGDTQVSGPGSGGAGAAPSSLAHTHDGTLVARNPSLRNRSAHSPYATPNRNSMRGSSNRTLRGNNASSGSTSGGQRRVPNLHLGEVPPPSAGLTRPSSMIRRQSAGSITPTGATFHGERPSRAPSSSSLYRAPLSGGGLRGRAGSSNSSHSAFRHGPRSGSGSASYPHQHFHHGLHGGSSTTSTLGPSGSLRGLSARRMSADGGTVVLRQRVPGSRKARPGSVHSTSSRPSSLYDVSHARDESMVSQGGDGGEELEVEGSHDDPHSAPVVSSRASGSGTPRRTSMDSAGGGGGGRHSPVTHSIFVAHRNRSSYKGPSSNPTLLAHHMSRRSASGQGSEGTTPGAEMSAASDHFSHGDAAAGRASEHAAPQVGTWRRSWGRPPPSWSGPVDQGPSRSELVSMMSAASSNKSKLRDVFSDRDDDDWEDEDDEPTFSGGLGQLDSAGGGGVIANNGWKSSPTVVDSPMKGFSGPGFSPALNGFTSSSMVRNNSGPGGALGRGSANVDPGLLSGSRSGGNSAGGSPNPSAGPSPSLLSQSRYAGVRNAFQPPALGRDVAPRMIAVSEEEDDEEEGAGGEAKSGGVGGESTGESTEAQPASGGSRILGRGSHAPPTAFKSGIVEEEEEEEE